MITLCDQWERGSNVVIAKWVFSWKWGVVRVALELVPHFREDVQQRIFPKAIPVKPRHSIPGQ